MVYSSKVKMDEILRSPKRNNSYTHAQTNEPVKCTICGKTEELIDDIQYRFCIPMFGIAEIEIKPRYFCKKCHETLKFDE